MHHRFETITVAELCAEAGLQWRERVKEHLVEMGEGRTSNLLKYSWDFLHFNLLLLKRWLCFPVWRIAVSLQSSAE